MIEVIPNWHPVAVHFTVALLITASVLFAAGTLFRKAASGGALTAAARWNLAIGAAVTVATLATGWSAYNTVDHDAPSHANMTVHLRWAVATALVFLAAAGVAWLERRKVAGAGVCCWCSSPEVPGPSWSRAGSAARTSTVTAWASWRSRDRATTSTPQAAAIPMSTATTTRPRTPQRRPMPPRAR